MAKATTKTQPTSSLADRTSEYAEAVVAGVIVAGPHVRNSCRRHLLDLEKGHERGLTFDREAAEFAFEFFEGVLRLSEGQFDGKPFHLHPSQAFIIGSLFGWKRADGTRRFRRAYIEQGKGNGKALSIDTPIPVPGGWSTMGALRVGDVVFDESGKPCRVVGATPVMIGRPCFRVGFSDGCEIIADAAHEWRVASLRTGAKKGPKPNDAPRKGGYAIRETQDIARTLALPASASKHPQAKWNHRVDVAGPLALPDVALPVAPYTLGAWLGDGDSDCARLSPQKKHSETTCRIGIGIGTGRRAASLNATLRAMGLLGNKHIPAKYLRSGEQQRMALLQGLMDTDGYVGDADCEFTTTLPTLRDGFMELLRSLGFKPTCVTGRATIDGRDCGEKYRVRFTAYADRPVFRLDRKAGRLRPRPATRALSQGRMIVACDEIPSVPVRCIEVDSPAHLYLAGIGMIPTHNSPMAGGIGLYGMTADKEAGAQIYAAAAKREQAGILFADAVKMVKQSPALRKRLEFSGGPGREFNIAHHPSGSFFRPVSRDTGKTGSGPRPYFVMADEVHELPDRSILEMLERGFKFRRQPLLFMITNSGSDRNSVAWEEHTHAVNVAAGTREAVNDPSFVGEALDDTTFSYVCALDGPRTEVYEFDIAVRNAVKSCTCNARITPTDLPSPQDFAALATRSSGEQITWQKVSGVKITPTVRLFLDAFATLATPSIGNNPTQTSPISGERSRERGPSHQTDWNSRESETGNIGSERLPPIQPGKATAPGSQSTGSQQNKSSQSEQRKEAAAECAVTSRSVSGWITATLLELYGDCSAIVAMQASVCSEIVSLLYGAHSATCKTRQHYHLRSGRLTADLPADDPLSNSKCWIKANPLLGVTITEEYLAEVVEQGKAIPGKLNGILRLHFCVWTDAESAWMTRATLEPCVAEFDVTEHYGKAANVGLDLSRNRDITAMAIVVKTGEDESGKPTFDGWIEAWTPGDTMRARELRDKLPYAAWAKQCHIHAPPGESINYRHVAQTLAEYAHNFNLRLVAYDRYAFKRFEEDVDELGLELTFAEHPQGGVRKGKPFANGADGLWMPGSVRLLEETLLERRIRLKANPVLISALMSAVTESDKWGNHWLAKERSLNKIDAAVALAMALGAAYAADIPEPEYQIFFAG